MVKTTVLGSLCVMAVSCGQGLEVEDPLDESVATQSTLQTPTTYTLWVHGRLTDGMSTRINDPTDFSFWGPSDVDAGINKRAVNWDGRSRIAEQNELIRNALDCYCTGDNWCQVAAYSAGDLQVGYALSLWGGTERVKRVAQMGADGTCASLDAGTQTGWNIDWVGVAAGAAGGSELADEFSGTADPLVDDLVTTTARSMYDHNQTRGVMFNLFVGAGGTWYSGTLPGEDDGVVAYHSSGGMAGAAGSALCNPGNWWCPALQLGTKASGTKKKWANHSVAFRDDAEAYVHQLGGPWGGLVGRLRDYAVVHSPAQ